ncbi:riboflavin synthase alpha chain [Aequorivita sublithincola DSM 14238]|uniref:Riboflavin synthase n=1 Tax=Aequorivita sublithincola (strain DSM 14238 / LMG 21431 / ACAM 643 / 9-3) TaxID=746697 RepID=I3YUG3_AEQSU|nr:riboflavin synthase [Aequorivita sublithincola]AFL80631.1 riboflavin synthase alpha chain [Aequorivita sublithincola DSM 14238]
MFTGIIETVGEIAQLTKEGENLHLEIKSSLAQELKIDQSVSHNGVCLTVVKISDNTYIVTAIKETLTKTNLKSLKKGSLVNLERAMKLGDRLDGHMVQGHVDGTAVCKNIEEANGSWVFTFEYKNSEFSTVEKGSITLNGVSLTVVNSKKGQFSVAIIPYTFENTNFKEIKTGDTINLEFDIIGKYVKNLMQPYL